MYGFKRLLMQVPGFGALFTAINAPRTPAPIYAIGDVECPQCGMSDGHAEGCPATRQGVFMSVMPHSDFLKFPMNRNGLAILDGEFTDQGLKNVPSSGFDPRAALAELEGDTTTQWFPVTVDGDGVVAVFSDRYFVEKEAHGEGWGVVDGVTGQIVKTYTRKSNAQARADKLNGQ